MPSIKTQILPTFGICDENPTRRTRITKTVQHCPDQQEPVGRPASAASGRVWPIDRLLHWRGGAGVGTACPTELMKS